MTNSRSSVFSDAISKSDAVRQLLAAGRDIEALRIAHRFKHLGEHRDTIRRGWEAYTYPSFARSLKRDPEALLQSAIAALHSLYGPSIKQGARP